MHARAAAVRVAVGRSRERHSHRAGSRLFRAIGVANCGSQPGLGNDAFGTMAMLSSQVRYASNAN